MWCKRTHIRRPGGRHPFQRNPVFSSGWLGPVACGAVKGGGVDGDG